MIGVALVAAACGSNDSGGDEGTSGSVPSISSPAAAGDSTRQFVAAVPGSSFTLGILSSGSGAWAYLCDDTGRTIELFGSATGGTLNLTDSVDTGSPATATLTGQLADDGFNGKLAVDGKTVDISARLAQNDEGVRWKAHTDGATQVLSTWVVGPDGFGGSKLTVATSTSSTAAPTLTESAEGAPPSDAEPVPFKFGDCFRAKKKLKQLIAAGAPVSDLIDADLARQSACGTLFGA